jgi:hypothetical protein
MTEKMGHSDNFTPGADVRIAQALSRTSILQIFLVAGAGAFLYYSKQKQVVAISMIENSK